MAQNRRYHLFYTIQKERGIAGPKTDLNLARLTKSCIFMSNVKAFFRTPTAFSFVDYHRLLSLGLPLLPVSSSSWGLSQISGTSNT